MLLKRFGLKQNFFGLLLVIFISLSCLSANRIITSFGHFWIPLVSYAFATLTQSKSLFLKKILLTILICIGFIVLSININLSQKPTLGLASGINKSAEFLKQNSLLSPIFNDYSTGGYLIFHLAHSHKLFVDNRAEAFPKEYFSNTYLPALEKNEDWFDLDKKYHFNTIFFDLTKYEERTFILNRLQDSNWAPVFADNYVIIFLKRNQLNTSNIRKYELHWTQVNPPFEGIMRFDKQKEHWYKLTT